jgi:hypothetical protein
LVPLHAAELALGYMPRAIPKGLYTAIAAAYDGAYYALGKEAIASPRDLQAALWTAKVGMGGDAGGRIAKRYADAMDSGPSCGRVD